MKLKMCALALVTVTSIACRTAHRDAPAPSAVAVIEPRSGSNVAGRIEFQASVSGIMYARVDLTGLEPNSVHGLHVHENPDCSAADASSAGPHFNPTGAPHGAPDVPAHHAGDLGNVTANANGEVHDHFPTQWLTLETAPRAVVGRSVVVHADRDDLMTQPAGNSGKRIGCGVVSMAAAMH